MPEPSHEPATRDPWGHEKGEDPDHLLDAAGRIPVNRDRPEVRFTVKPLGREKWWQRSLGRKRA